LLEAPVIIVNIANKSADQAVDIKLVYWRLGHLRIKQLKKVYTEDLVREFLKNCEICIKAVKKRLQNYLSVLWVIWPLKQIYIDY
jgi:hypothetical protein